MKKGVFTGSFDPFTIGHKDIVDRALPLFDELTICIGINETKKYAQTVDERIATIKQIYANDPRVKVDSWSGLTVDYCQKHDIHYIIKGVRNVRDFEYEREQADMNRHLSMTGTHASYDDHDSSDDHASRAAHASYEASEKQCSCPVETILFYSDPTLTAVSSSLVKVLKSYGRDVSEFLP